MGFISFTWKKTKCIDENACDMWDLEVHAKGAVNIINFTSC